MAKGVAKAASKTAPVAPPELPRLIGHRDALEPLIEAHVKSRLASTLLFAGPAGIGKKLAARTLAQALVCEQPVNGHGCTECGPCKRVATGQSESVRIVEPDGASIKIEQARDVLQFISLQKLGRARVVIFDQAHLMNPQTANALLKSLEEPPAGTYFILITPLAASILPTIRSRAQLVRFRPLSKVELKQILGKEADDWILRSARGSVEVARQMMESQSEFRELDEALVHFLRASREGFPAAEAAALKELTKERAAQTFVAQSLQAFARDLFHARLDDMFEAPPGLLASMGAESFGDLSLRDVNALADFALSVEGEMARNIDRGLLFENLAIRWRQAGGEESHALD